MAYFLKGIGDAQTGKNEIKPSFDARINKFLTGHTAGIVKGELEEFGSAIIDRGVRVNSGMLCAYGYFAMSDAPSDFFYSVPTGTLYAQIYAEIDLVPRPQNFEIKTTAPASSNSFSAVQNNLITADGKYQTWLYTVTLSANGAITLTDRRTFITAPLNALNATNYLSGSTANSIADKITDFQNRLATLESGSGGGVETLVPIVTTPTAWTKFGSNLNIPNADVSLGTEVFAHVEVRTFNDSCVTTLVGRVCLGNSSLSAAELSRPMFGSAINSKPIGVIEVGFVYNSAAASRISLYAGVQGLVNLGGWASNSDFSGTTSGQYRVTKLYKVVR